MISPNSRPFALRSTACYFPFSWTFIAHFTLLDGLLFADNGAVRQTIYPDSKELEAKLKHYEKQYNARIPQKTLGHRPPQDALR